VVNVANRADVDVRFVSLELFFCHFKGLFGLRLSPVQMMEPMTGFEPVTSSLPRTCSAN